MPYIFLKTVEKEAALLKPQAYITSETFMSPEASREAAFFMRMLRMKS